MADIDTISIGFSGPTLNWEGLRMALIGAVVDAVNSIADDGQTRARKDAPVRKIFAGGRRTMRLRTATEIRKDRILRIKMGLAPEILGVSRTVDTRTRMTKTGVPVSRTLGNRANRFETRVGEPPITLNARELESMNFRHLKRRQEEFGLTSRGRWELQKRTLTGPRRAISQQTITLPGEGGLSGEMVTITSLGGRLRDSIQVMEASADQYPIIKARVVAGNREVDYAKYQELGTRHNPAHPFLRPRLPEFRAELPVRLRKFMGGLGR